jgi:hypothetical protein
MALTLLLALLLDACLSALTAPDSSAIACHVMSRRICAAGSYRAMRGRRRRQGGGRHRRQAASSCGPRAGRQ